jgi:hypothetical protein
LEAAVPRRPNLNAPFFTLRQPGSFGAAAVKHGHLVPLLLQGAGKPNGIQLGAAYVVRRILVKQVKNTHDFVRLGMVC